jgi:hypothetical protein
MRPRACIWVIFALCSAAVERAEALPSLAELESRVAASPAGEMLEQAYEAARDNVAAADVNLGLSIYGNAGLGQNHDLIDETHSRSYRQSSVGAGLQLPLLGSRLQLQDGLSDQRLQLWQLDARRELERRERVRRVRKAYAEYWQAQRFELLAQEYLQDERPMEHQLDLRTRAGLLLDSDRLEFLSGFALAHRDEALSGAAREAALTTIRELAGAPIEGGVAAPPIVPAACLQYKGLQNEGLQNERARSEDADNAWADLDPELLELKRVIALRESNPRDSAFYPVQSTIQVGYQGRSELTTGRSGGAAAVMWSFQVPIGYGTERRLLSRAAAAERARAQLEYEVRSRELEAQRQELVARAAALQASIEFASARLAAADAAVRERSQRAAQLEGDVIEALQRARLGRYNAAKTLAEADAARVFWYADAARFENLPCASSAKRAGAQRGGRGLYVWRAAGWLADAATDAADAEFARLRAAGLSRLLISLDAGQVRDAIDDPAPLAAAVRRTQERGFTVELLLGDPGWILPRERGALLAIIERLKSVPFDALHLDLEPGQLDTLQDTAQRTHTELLAALAATLEAAAAASPWPLELSMRPRDLDVQLGEETFGAVLRRLRVAPTLMVYVANPERAVAIAAPLLRRYPDLRFSVALSIEKSLGPDESLWALPNAERRRRIESIEGQLAADNFAGITLQLEDGWVLAQAAGGE